MQRFFAKSSRTLVCLAALAAAGCAETTGRLTLPNPEPRFDIAHPIHVEQAPRLIELPVGAPLADRDAARLGAFARSYLAEGETPVTIAFPRDGDAGLTVRAVAGALEREGVPLRRILRGPYDTASQGDRGVVVSYEALTAFTNRCPDVWEETLDTFDNRSPARFGCATQTSLAAMIADPADLLDPAPAAPAAATRRRTVLENYEAGTATGAERPENTVNTRSAQ